MVRPSGEIAASRIHSGVDAIITAGTAAAASKNILFIAMNYIRNRF